MTSQLRIRTPEGVLFAYSLAGPVTRCLAVAVDILIIMFASSISSQLLTLGGLIESDFTQALALLSYFAISILYGAVLEWFWRGQTVGKRMLRLRVLDANGLRLQFHQVLMRNLLRFVDMLPAFYLLGGAVSLFSPRAQRLGDIAAGTVVVQNPRHSEPDLDQLLSGKFNSLRQHPHLEARLRQRVSPDEARLILNALVRRDELEPAARVELFSELAEHFKSLVAFPAEEVESLPDEQYVRNVVDILFRPRSAVK